MYNKIAKKGAFLQMTSQLATWLQVCSEWFNVCETPFTGFHPDVWRGEVPLSATSFPLAPGCALQDK